MDERDRRRFTVRSLVGPGAIVVGGGVLILVVLGLKVACWLWVCWASLRPDRGAPRRAGSFPALPDGKAGKET